MEHLRILVEPGSESCLVNIARLVTATNERVNQVRRRRSIRSIADARSDCRRDSHDLQSIVGEACHKHGSGQHGIVLKRELHEIDLEPLVLEIGIFVRCFEL